MYHFITTEKDATIYQEEPNQNTGLDPILEVGSGRNFTNIKRSLLKFDLDDMPVATDYTASLLLKQTQSQELKVDYDVFVYPVTENWEMGVGRRNYDYDDNGVSWEYRDGESLTRWSVSGSVFNDTVFGSQTFSYQSADIDMDITHVVDFQLSAPNEGIVVKFSETDENGSVDFGTLKFFSKETHTIFQPYLRVGWDDSQYNTGSLQSLDDFNNIKVQPILKPTYNEGTTQRIRVKSREKYPPKSFDKFQYNTDFYLPQNTYYRIIDIVSKHEIIPYSENSKVSCDPYGNYFELDFSNWEVDRVYEVQFKTERRGNTEFYKDTFIFTLIK